MTTQVIAEIERYTSRF